MKVREIMTLGAITVDPDATIAEAASLMLRQRVSGLPVVSEFRSLAGIVTEGDLMRCVDTGSGRDRPGWLIFLFGAGEGAEHDARIHAQKVEEAMTQDVVTVTPGTPADEAVDLMQGLGIKRLPVLGGGRLVGIVSRSNLLQTLVQRGSDKAPGNEDKALRIDVLGRLEKLDWTSPSAVRLDVRDGVAHLTGTVADRSMRDSLLNAVQTVTGVREIRDELMLDVS